VPYPRWADRRKRKPFMKLIYHPIRFWMKRAFANATFAQLVQYHGGELGMRGSIEDMVLDIYDGEAWKQMVIKDGEFYKDLRNLVLALCSDGVQLHKDDAGNGTWPFYITALNLPPTVRTRAGVTTVVCCVEGKVAEVKDSKLDLQPILELITDEINYLYAFGWPVEDANNGMQTFNVRAKLLQVRQCTGV
jgi:hypothetical protein